MEDNSLKAFIKVARKRKYPSRSVVLCFIDSPDLVSYVLSGTLQMVGGGIRGEELILSYLTKGCFFGAIEFFSGKESGPISVRAKTSCEIAELSRVKFMELADKHPDLVLSLSRQLAEGLSGAYVKMLDLVNLDVSGRVARALLDLTKQPDAMTHPEGMQIRITRSEIGKLVGCSREMVGRTLAEFNDKGFIRYSGKTVLILGEPVLTDMSSLQRSQQ